MLEKVVACLKKYKWCDPESLEEAGLSQGEIVSAIQGSDISLPGGTVKRDDLSLTTRVVKELSNVEELEELVVGVNPAGDELTLTDVAEVRVALEDQEMLTRSINRKRFN